MGALEENKAWLDKMYYEPAGKRALELCLQKAAKEEVAKSTGVAPK